MRRPALLTAGMYLSMALGAWLLVATALAPFDIGTFLIDGAAVSGREFLATGGWSFAVAGVFLLAIAYGLWREHAWARPLMAAWWPTVFLGTALLDANDPEVVGASLMGLAITAIPAALYLYLGHAAKYFTSLRLHSESPGEPVAAPDNAR